MISDVIKTGMIDDQPANMAAILNVKFYITRRDLYQNALSACFNNAYSSPMKLFEDNLRTASGHIQSDLIRLEEFNLYKQCSINLSDSMLMDYVRVASTLKNRVVTRLPLQASSTEDTETQSDAEDFEEISRLILKKIVKWGREIHKRREAVEEDSDDHRE